MNVQHSRSLLDVRMVEKHGHLPPDSLSGVMLKTIRTIEDKNIPVMSKQATVDDNPAGIRWIKG